MYKELVGKVGNAAKGKVATLNNSIVKYFLLSAMAGLFVGLGIFLIMSIGGNLAGAPSTKIIMGASFGVALSLVVMVGSELFTGNNFIMTVGALDKAITWMDAIKIWIVSYIGNFAGSIFAGILFVNAGLATGPVGDFINKVAAGKMSGAFTPLLFKGILCNILVCLAVLCAIKLKEETAKLIMIFWCLFAFITAGFEHSIANMTIFATALMAPHPETVTFSGMFANLIPVTIGNFIGGSLIVGAGYWFIGKDS